MNFNKEIRFIVMLVVLFTVFSSSVFAVLISTNPADGATKNVTNTNYTVFVEVQNDNLGFQLTDATVEISYSPDDVTISLNDSTSENLGNLSIFPAANWSRTHSWLLDFSAIVETTYTIVVNVTTDEAQTSSSTFDLVYIPETYAYIYVNSSDKVVQALDSFTLTTITENNGTRNMTDDFNISVTYDNTVFALDSCSPVCDGDEDIGGGNNFAYYTASNLGINETQEVDFVFTAIDDRGANYTKTMLVKSYQNSATPQPEVTITPVPTYVVNITEIYNASITPNITTDNLTVFIPTTIKNIGNQEVSAIDLAMAINSSSMGSVSYTDVAVNEENVANISYKFSSQGYYNVSVEINGTNSVYDLDSKLVYIHFNFNDSDGDGYYSDVNGGRDCDDSNAQVNPSESEECKDGIDNDCDGRIDEGCSSRDDDSSSGGSTGPVPPPPSYPDLPVVGTFKEISLDSPVRFKSSDGEKHTITLKKIAGSRIAIEIRSEPISVSLSIGEEKTVDLNGNGVDDFLVRLEEIKESSIRLFFSEIEERPEEVEEQEEEIEEVKELEEEIEKPKEEAPKQEKESNLTIDKITGRVVEDIKEEPSTGIVFIILGIVIIVAVIAVISYNKNKKRRFKL